MTAPAKWRASTANAREFQTAFFQRMGLSQQFRLLFDALPEVHFFAKDRESRFVAVSPEVVRRLGGKREEDLLGRRDSDFLPPQLSASIEADDAIVMNSGQPLLDRLETWYGESGVLDWFLTTKYPMRDDRGEVIGIMGFVRPYEGADGRRHAWSIGSGLDKAIEQIRAHLSGSLTTEELATKAGVSKRQLHRKFVEAFSMGPQEFIQRTRVQAACELLARGRKSLAEVAKECGFYDQSALTRYFRRHLGHTPAAYLRERQSAVKSVSR